MILFNSLKFIFRFFPIFLAVYYLTPARFREIILFFGSIIFYAMGTGRMALALIGLTLINYFLGKLVFSRKTGNVKSSSRKAFIAAMVIDVGSLVLFKVLAGFTIADQADMERAAAKIAAGLGGAVLVKGGHLTDSADDLLWTEGRAVWFSSPRVDNPNTHGTGCTLSSAIACNLAKGRSVEESVRRAKAYITGALKAGLDLGKGSGPLDHAWATPEIDFE